MRINKIKLILFVIIAFTVLFYFHIDNYEFIDSVQIFDNIYNENNNFEVYFLNVGQGDAAIIKTPHNKYIMVDSGPNDAQNKLQRYLRILKVKEIEMLIATHPHEDHIGNMDFVIYNYKINHFYTVNKTTNTQNYENMLMALKRKNIKINLITKKESYVIDGVEILFLSPAKKYDEINNMCIVLKVNYKNYSLLLMADAMHEVEEYLIEQKEDLKADILKIAHHGSQSSSSSNFLKMVLPKYAVISAGYDNPYGHPHTEVLNRLMDLKRTIGTKTFITYKDGTIKFTIKNNKIYVSTFYK